MTQDSQNWQNLMTFDDAGSSGTALVPTEHHLTFSAATVQVPHINGVQAGTVVGAILEVRFQQLRLAPSPDLLYSHYKPEQDKHLAAYADAVEAMGDLVPPLIVQPAQENITIGDETLPVYLVYHDPVLYAALTYLKRSRIRIEIPTVPHPGAILLYALSRQQHLRAPSLLDLADAVRRLFEDYKYSAVEIARHARRDGSETEDTTYISRLAAIAHLPAPVRDMMDRGTLSYSHAREIAGRFGSDPVRAAQVARLSVDGDYTVAQLTKLINALEPISGAPSARIIDDGRSLRLQYDQALHLASDRRQAVAQLPTYGNYIAARPAAIISQSRHHPASIIPHPSVERVAVRLDYVKDLAAELAAISHDMPVRDFEALLLGRLEATRQAMVAAGILNEIGTTAPIVDSQEQQA